MFHDRNSHGHAGLWLIVSTIITGLLCRDIYRKVTHAPPDERPLAERVTSDVRGAWNALLFLAALLWIALETIVFVGNCQEGHPFQTFLPGFTLITALLIYGLIKVSVRYVMQADEDEAKISPMAKSADWPFEQRIPSPPPPATPKTWLR